MKKKELKRRLEICMIGGNHLANYLLGKNIIPDRIKTHLEAQEQLNNDDYDVWCCWNALMEARLD